jgi:hypothetical protein
MRWTKETGTFTITVTWWNDNEYEDAVSHLDQLTHELDLALIRNADGHTITWAKDPQ